MLREVEQYYFGHYCRHFGTPEFAAALAAIPFVFNWDDHDIFDVSKCFRTQQLHQLTLALGESWGPATDICCCCLVMGLGAEPFSATDIRLTPFYSAPARSIVFDLGVHAYVAAVASTQFC